MYVDTENLSIGCDENGREYLCFGYHRLDGKVYHHLYKVNSLGKFIDRLRALYEHGIVEKSINERIRDGILNHSVK